MSSPMSSSFDTDTRVKTKTFETQSMAPTRSVCRRETGVTKKQAIKDASQGRKSVVPYPKEFGPGSHSWCYSMLRHHSHRGHANAYRLLYEILICVSVLNFILETESFFQTCCTSYFNVFEAVVSTIFALEYFMKIGTAHERRAFAHIPRDVARLKWVFSSESLIDFVSWSPLFIELLSGANPDKSEVLRMLRLVRILKLPVVWRALRLVNRVIYYNCEILFSAFFVCFIMLLGCSILLLYTRPAYDPKDDFSSLLCCMYLAVLMLTGQGEPYGVMPWYTRVVICITALFAIAQFAIPASMLTWGFEQEAEHNIVKETERVKKAAERQAQGQNIPESSSSSDEDDRLSEWDGYLEQVLGSEFEGSDSSETSKKDGAKAPSGDFPAKQMGSDAKELLELAAAGNDHLTKEERRRAKAIFIRLDTDNDDRLDWRKIRAITETDQQAQDLIGQLAAFQEITGDSSITMREFFTWLGSVKMNHTRYGDKVLLRLLNQMEYRVFGPGSISSSRKVRKATIKASDLLQRADFVVAARGAAEGTALATSAPQQFLQIADGFGNLQHENDELEKKILKLEEELAKLKANE